MIMKNTGNSHHLIDIIKKKKKQKYFIAVRALRIHNIVRYSYDAVY